MHYIISVIIPNKIYQQGESNVHNYIREIMEPYDENYEGIKPYVKLTRAELEAEFQTYLNSSSCTPEYSTLKSYSEDYCGYNFDLDGNVTTTYNKFALYDWYIIGGRWSGNLDVIKPGNFNGNLLSIKEHNRKYQDSKHEAFSTVIDGNGQLHQNPTVTWLPSHNPSLTMEDWYKTYQDILNQSMNDYIIVIDCHI